MSLKKIVIAGLALAALAPLGAVAGPVNINTADAATLAAELTGVGPALAEAIVADRKANGNFATAEALTRVKGIGTRIVELNKTNILVSDPAPQR
jgi:competence protein ComEA